MEIKNFLFVLDADLHFRFCREEDLPRLAELEKICFVDPWSMSMLKEELTHPQGAYFSAQTNGLLQGYAGLWIWELLKEAHVSNVAVSPEYRGKGIGRMIILGIMTLAEIKGAVSMTLEVRESNDIAQRLYEKLDFAFAGTRPRYYANGENARIFWNYDISTTLQKCIVQDSKYAQMYKYMYKTLRCNPEP